MKKIFIFLVAVLMVLGLVSCRDSFRYYDVFPELHVIATNSLIGVEGNDGDKIIILEEDDFGRKMFSFSGFSSNGVILSILISQKTTETHSYFFDNVNFLVTAEEEVYYNSEIHKNKVYESFSKQKIEKLKLKNDWGKEINEEKLFGIKIRRKKFDTISTSNLHNGFKSVSNDFHVAYNALLTTDKNGKSLYYMRGRKYDHVSDGYIFTKSYLFMFSKKGKLVGENAVKEVTDFWNYQDQLAAFKKANGWNGSSK